MTWFRVDASMAQHLKVKRLARRLKVPVAHAAGLVVTLWCTAKTDYPSGVLGRLDADDMADLCGWDGEPGPLLAALVQVGLVDTQPVDNPVDNSGVPVDNSQVVGNQDITDSSHHAGMSSDEYVHVSENYVYVLHDWQERQPDEERMAKERERKARYAAHVKHHVKKGVSSSECWYCRKADESSSSAQAVLKHAQAEPEQCSSSAQACSSNAEQSSSRCSSMLNGATRPNQTKPDQTREVSKGLERTSSLFAPPADADVPEKEPALDVDDGQQDQPALPVDPALTDPASADDGKPVSDRTKADKSLYTPEFEAWWRAYPHRDGVKVGKAPAAKAWAKLPKKDHPLVMQATSNLAASGRMAKDPHRFLAPHLRSEAPWREFLDIPLGNGSKGRDRASQLQNEAFRDDPTHYTTRPVNLDDDFD